MAARYAVLVGALPVSIRDSVEVASPSLSATSSSLIERASRRRLNSVPSRRRRTVGPIDAVIRPPLLEGTLSGSGSGRSAGTAMRPLGPQYDNRKRVHMGSQLRFRLSDLYHALARHALPDHDEG